MGDGPHYSDKGNDSGNPAVWRRLTYSDDYGDHNVVWDNASYVEMFKDGHIGIYTSHISNSRWGDTAGRPDVSFAVELWFAKDDGDARIRFGGADGNTADYPVVFRGLIHGSEKWTFYTSYPAPPNAVEYMRRADRLLAYRHIGEMPGRDGIVVPIPVPDPTGG